MGQGGIARRSPSDADAAVATLDNGVRVVVIRLPHLATARCAARPQPLTLSTAEK
jgi:hypothetical protein